MRLGVFGGTFDPPHRAHVAVAAAARDALGLDLVEMIPSARPPHRGRATADAFERLVMTALGCLDEPRVVSSPREIRRGSTSFTVDTLREIGQEHAEAELYLILGGDGYDDLPHWRDPHTILRLAHLAVIARPGSDGLDAVRAADRPRLREAGQPPPEGAQAVYRVPMEPLAVSSRAIRRRLRAGEDPGDALPELVHRFISKHQLYRDRDSD
ncbi:MAG: nicotinate (nicotinamide) nucleotide adenylyltransferase [Acidobacteriota bacterium]|nr:MAG: nicotinate (nicotinamide) nucleotide adenylyltransferase [Acidobacteriota bacterium]